MPGSLACVGLAALLLGRAAASIDDPREQTKHRKGRRDLAQSDSSWAGLVPSSRPDEATHGQTQTRYLVASKEDSWSRVAAVLHNCTCSLFLKDGGDWALCARVKVRVGRGAGRTPPTSATTHLCCTNTNAHQPTTNTARPTTHDLRSAVRVPATSVPTTFGIRRSATTSR